MSKYISYVTESIISEVHTDKEHSRVTVFFKTKDGEIEKTLSKQEIAESLNQLANIRNHKIAISENVEQDIVKDIKDIHREMVNMYTKHQIHQLKSNLINYLKMSKLFNFI
ncbi:MAG: hypothetical protein ACR5KV_07910 [Wolbachia sp.]